MGEDGTQFMHCVATEVATARAKAFDSIPHCCLLNLLISGEICYLTFLTP